MNKKKTKELEKIDKAFEYLLLLITIITAMEFQYVSAFSEQFKTYGMQFFLKIFTFPLMIVISLWLVKSLIIENEKLDRYLSEICWDLLNLFFCFYLVFFYTYGILPIWFLLPAFIPTTALVGS